MSCRIVGKIALVAFALFSATFAHIEVLFGQESLDVKTTLQKRVEKLLEEQIKVVTATGVRYRQPDERETIDALSAIASEERAGALYWQAIDELGTYALTRQEAVRALIDNIDEPVSPAPSLTRHPLEHLRAGQYLVKCGLKVRTPILDSLVREQTQRSLHIKAYILAQLDQTDERTFDVELTIARLKKEVDRVQESGMMPNEKDRTICIANIRSMIQKMRDPLFSVNLIETPASR